MTDLGRQQRNPLIRHEIWTWDPSKKFKPETLELHPNFRHFKRFKEN